MNKAFVREPEPDGRAYCPQCGSLGSPVGTATLNQHVADEFRAKLGDSAWFCGFAKCNVAYFDLFERVIPIGELQHTVYPKDPQAAICPCFGFMLADAEACIQRRTPEPIRELLAKSKTDAARCSVLAADGQCCMREVQRLYIRGLSTAE